MAEEQASHGPQGRGGAGGPPPVRVFVSYAHDDAAHVDRVRELWWFLRAHGVDARLDQLAGEQRQDWAEWMAREVGDAAYVLSVRDTFKRSWKPPHRPPQGG